MAEQKLARVIVRQNTRGTAEAKHAPNAASRIWIAGYNGLRGHVPGRPSRTALASLVQQGRLPKPYKLSSGDPGRLFWDLAEVTAAVEALRV
jgi:hypothetical protein